MCAYAYTCTHMSIYICTHVFEYMYTIYTYIHIYAYMHVYKSIYVHTVYLDHINTYSLYLTPATPDNIYSIFLPTLFSF